MKIKSYKALIELRQSTGMKGYTGQVYVLPDSTKPADYPLYGLKDGEETRIWIGAQQPEFKKFSAFVRTQIEIGNYYSLKGSALYCADYPSAERFPFQIIFDDFILVNTSEYDNIRDTYKIKHRNKYE